MSSFILYDYLQNGYYSEKEIQYRKSDSGKISWKRTIQKIKPCVSEKGVIFLDFVSKKSIAKADIITQIHEYCVYESFSKLGWLFLNSTYVPRMPLTERKRCYLVP